MVTTRQILQNLVDGQNVINDNIKRLEKKIDDNTERLDNIGFQVANLEDDAPTIAEFDNLTERVEKIEKHLAFN